VRPPDTRAPRVGLKAAIRPLLAGLPAGASAVVPWVHTADMARGMPKSSSGFSAAQAHRGHDVGRIRVHVEQRAGRKCHHRFGVALLHPDVHLAEQTSPPVLPFGRPALRLGAHSGRKAAVPVQTCREADPAA
jgi:hypothetical protein